MSKQPKDHQSTPQTSRAIANHAGAAGISRPGVQPVIQGAFWYRQYEGGPAVFYGGEEDPMPDWDFDKEPGRNVYYPNGKIGIEQYLLLKKKAEKKAKNKANSTMPDLPMTAIFERAVGEVEIPNTMKKKPEMLNIFLDIGETELRAMDIDAKMNFPAYMKDSLAYTSCHNTAVKLVERMSDPAEETSAYVGKNKAEAASSDPATNWMEPVAISLQSAIGNDITEGNRTIFEVHCGAHGFVILVRNGHAEILQSFANAISLVKRMQKGPLVFDKATIQKLTTDLASGTKGDRDNAAQIIAYCDSGMFGLEPAFCFQYRWRRAELLGDDALLGFFKRELKNSFDFVKKSGLLKRL